MHNVNHLIPGNAGAFEIYSILGAKNGCTNTTDVTGCHINSMVKQRSKLYSVHINDQWPVLMNS